MGRPELLDEFAAAEFIGMSVSFLRAARSRGVLGNRTPPPPHLLLGRTVKYDVADLKAWLSDRRVDPASRLKSSAQAGARNTVG